MYHSYPYYDTCQLTDGYLAVLTLTSYELYNYVYAINYKL